MPHRFTATCATAALLLAGSSAQATDVLSQDDQGYELTVILDSGAKTVAIGPKGDLRSVCSKSCVIRMPDGQSVQVKESDIVFIIDGKISVYE